MYLTDEHKYARSSAIEVASRMGWDIITPVKFICDNCLNIYVCDHAFDPSNIKTNDVFKRCLSEMIGCEWRYKKHNFLKKEKK